MERKSFPVTEMKAASDGKGQFEALVAVFGNVDSVGDRILPGAFTRTLKERGYPAVVWSHQWSTPPIGSVMDAKETDAGLVVKGQLFLDESQTAREVWAAMKNRGGDDRPPLREFSFAFDIVDSAEITEDGMTIRELKDVDLFEVGPTLIGANSETELLAVKAGDTVTVTTASTGGYPPATNQPSDSPPPSSPEGDQEAAVRIARLATEQPMHLTERAEQ